VRNGWARTGFRVQGLGFRYINLGAELLGTHHVSAIHIKEDKCLQYIVKDLRLDFGLV